MSVDQPFNIYQEQLSSQYLGIALWNPNPVKHLFDCGHISIGDVGYLSDGDFIRMFNVTLPWNDPSNLKLGIPKEYRTLEQGHFVNVRDIELGKVEYFSPHMSTEESAGNVYATTPEEAKGQTYKCRARSCGALLSLPHGGLRTDVIRTKVFEEYVRDNADSWYTWAQDNRLGVERMEDLILITGCTLVTSWAAAVFDGHNTPEDAASISLHAQKFESGGAEFFWRNRHGNVDYHNSHFNNPLSSDLQYLPRNQCVFIKVCRAKSTFFGTKHLRVVAEPLPSDPNNRQERTSFQNDNLRAAAEPPPDDPDDPENRRKRDIQALLQGNRVPNFPLDFKQLRVRRVMDYDAKVSAFLEDANPEGDIATAHGDDLQLTGSKDPEAFTTDAAQRFSRENKPPALIENGNMSPRSLQGWEDLNSDFHSINGDDMRKWSQDNLSQEQLEASAMKRSPSPSTIYLNESSPSTSTRSTIYLNEGYSSNGLRLSLSEAVIAENTDFIKTFVGRSQESHAITSGELKKKPPPPAPRQTQQDSSSSTTTLPPSLHPLRPSRGTPPLAPPGVDPSWTAFLDELQRHGVGEAVIAENMDFIKAFVRRSQESDAKTNGAPKKKPMKKLPPPAPRRVQQDSSSSTATPPPSLHPLPPSRGTPPRAPPGVDPSWTAFLEDLQHHGVGEAVIAENMDFIKAFVRRSQESDAMTNGSNGEPKKKKPPPPAPRRAQQDSSSSTTTQPPSLHPLRPSRDTPPRALPSSAEPSMQGSFHPFRGHPESF